MPNEPVQPQLLQAELATLNKWMRQTAADRSQQPLNDRLKALLWSWPIFPILRAKENAKEPVQYPKPVWAYASDGKDIRQRGAVVLAELTKLAQTVYPDMVYPEAVYMVSGEGGSLDSRYTLDAPSKVHNDDFKKRCSDVCDQLRTLPGLTVPDPEDDLLWLYTLLEHGWGDGSFDDRRELQDSVVKRLQASIRRQVCEIGERARDEAYHRVRIDRCLDERRLVKEEATSLIDWLCDARTHASFIEAHIADIIREVASKPTSLRKDLAVFYAGFQMMERVAGFVDHYMKSGYRARQRYAGSERHT